MFKFCRRAFFDTSWKRRVPKTSLNKVSKRPMCVRGVQEVFQNYRVEQGLDFGHVFFVIPNGPEIDSGMVSNTCLVGDLLFDRTISNLFGGLHILCTCDMFGQQYGQPTRVACFTGVDVVVSKVTRPNDQMCGCKRNCQWWSLGVV